MDDMDRALEAIKVQIKKEIVDNYFAARVELEEETKFLEEEVMAYQKKFAAARQKFLALYQALGSENVISRVMELLALSPWPAYEEYRQLNEAERARLISGRSRRGFTARRRHLHLIYDIYQELAQTHADLAADYAKILANLRLLNEDVDKFNLSFDFGLIAAQIEAMEGGGVAMCGGLMCEEREELSTRMRFKKRALTNDQLPPPPKLPPLAQVRPKLAELV